MTRARILAIALVLGLTAVSLAQPIEVTIWTRGSWAPGTVDGNIFTRYVEEFNRTHPDILIIHEIGDREAFMVAYASGLAPDILVDVGPLAGELGGKDGVLLALDPFIDGANGVPRDAYVADLWSFSTVHGKVYQLAADTNERGLFVNRNAAEESGIDTSQSISDWSDLLDWARRLTRRVADEVQTWGYDANLQYGGDRWNWIWLNDGAIFDEARTQSMLNHPNTIEAAQFAADMVHVYGVAPRPGSVAGTSRDNFLRGDYNMIMWVSTFASEPERRGDMKFITVAGPPGTGKHGGRFSGATNSTFAIADTSKSPEAAWEFIRFLLYEHGVEFAQDRGGIPYLLEGLSVPKYQTQPWNAFAQSIMTFNPRNNYNLPIEESVWNGHFSTAWGAVVRGEEAPEIAFTRAAEAINAALRQADQ